MLEKIIYIRDDDVHRHNKSFIRVFNFVKKYKVPLIYGVVPGLMDKKIIQFLNKEKSLNPHLFDICQHGFRHINHNRELSKKYEFGPTRSYLQQKHDILKGYYKMSKSFRRNFTPAFIPPFHGYNKDTLKIINEMKLLIFSAGIKTAFKNKNFIDLPAGISLNDYDHNGRPTVPKTALMIKRILAFLADTKKTAGIVFHHSAIRNVRDFKKMKIFFLFLARLNAEKKIKIILFSKFL